MISFLRTEFRRLVTKAGYSLDGWRAAWASELSLRQWLAANAVSAALAFALDLTAGERALILALGILVLAAEILNTAVEELVDMVSPELHPSAKKIKDCGSAAVTLVALAGAVAWVVILIG